MERRHRGVNNPKIKLYCFSFQKTIVIFLPDLNMVSFEGYLNISFNSSIESFAKSNSNFDAGFSVAPIITS